MTRDRAALAIGVALLAGCGAQRIAATRLDRSARATADRYVDAVGHDGDCGGRFVPRNSNLDGCDGWDAVDRARVRDLPTPGRIARGCPGSPTDFVATMGNVDLRGADCVVYGSGDFVFRVWLAHRDGRWTVAAVETDKEG